MCLTSKVEQEEQQPPSHIVFINYYEKDSPYAERLYSDLRAASLNPWIDKENLLPGQNIKVVTENAIRRSDYFVALLSKESVGERGDVTRQIKTALDFIEEVPETEVYFIPARLDGVNIPFNALRDIQHVDMFPKWERGLEKILRVMGVDDRLIEMVINHQSNISPFVSLDTTTQVQIQTFKGEKQFFIGRQNYINQIIKDKLRNPCSKVSIVGPGGSGKSQLAFRAMHQYLKEDIFDIVIPIYFDEGLLPFDKFLLQIAQIMGVKANDFELNTTIEQRKDKIRGLFQRKKHPLIYLDNFETVSMILNKKTSSETKVSILNAKQITDFLNNVIPLDNTSILVTSRERVNNLVNEELTDLEGLNINDSMELFNAIVRPDLKNQIGNTKDEIEEILKKTGGHPLSIEIIARNLRSIYELENLSNNLGSMGDPTRAEERFQTLQACFDYTIKRLDNKLQGLIPKLTLFESPFPISAAVEIFGITENEILDLYDRSLLQLVNSDELYGRIHNPEYWLYNFYLPVRGHVEVTMEKNGLKLSGLELEFGEKFSEYYYNLLESTYFSIGKETHRSSLARFNLILQGGENDFQRAVELATDRHQSAGILSYLGLITTELGMFSKALDYHNSALEIDESLNDRVGMGRDYTNIGIVLLNMGYYQKALDYHNKALDIREELNDRVGMGMTYTNIGNVLTSMGKYQQALDYHKKALEIGEELNDRVGMGRDYSNIGSALFEMGNYQEALEYYSRSLEIRTGLNDRVGMAKNYTNIGLVLRNMGNYQQALDYHKKALEIGEELNDRVGMAKNYTNIGLVLRNMGNYQQALDYHKKALEIGEELNDRVGMALDYKIIGNVLYSMGNYQQALDYHKKALEIDEELNDRDAMAEDYSNIGLVLSDMDNYHEALEYHSKSLEIRTGLNDRVGMAKSYTNIGRVLSGVGNYPEALDYYKKALGIHEELNDRDEMANDYLNLGSVHYFSNNLGEALDSYTEALGINESINDRVGMASDYWGIGNVLTSMGNYQQALDYHNKALEIHEALKDKVGMGKDYTNIGVALFSIGNYQQALDYHNKALEIHEALKDKVGMSADYTNIGVALSEMGNYQKALDYLNKALAIRTDLNDKVELAKIYANVGLVMKELNKQIEAVESVKKGLNILLELEKETGYHLPLIENLKQLVESLKDEST